MISIPIRINGKVSIKSTPGGNITIENMKNYLVDSLRHEEAKSVDIEQNQIRFDAGFFRWFRHSWNWNILLPITTGIISLETKDDTIDIN